MPWTRTNLVFAPLVLLAACVPPPPRVKTEANRREVEDALPKDKASDPGADRLVGAPASAAAPAPAAPAKLTLDELTVAVRPSQVAPGGQPEIILSYRVGGVPANGTVEVYERRDIQTAGVTIATLELRPARPAGSFVSSQKLVVPPGAAKGVYNVQATLSAGGTKAEGSALFEVK